MIRWVTKLSSRADSSNADVSVSVCKNKNRMQTCFTLRNDCHKRITGTEYIKSGIDEDKCRIYFISMDKKKGYKLYSKGKEVSKHFKVNEQWINFVGDYDLTFDNKENLWYIDAGKKK